MSNSRNESSALIFAFIMIFNIILIATAAVTVPAAALEFSEEQRNSLSEVEQKLRGEISGQENSERLERAERDLYGRVREGEPELRLSSLESYVLGGERSPGMEFLLAALEKNKFGSARSEPLLDRLAALEAELGLSGELALPESIQADYPGRELGRDGALPRLQKLLVLSEEEGNITANGAEELIEIAPGESFTVRIETAVNSGDIETGRRVNFSLEENFVIDDVLILPAGAAGELRVTGTDSRSYFGQDGEIHFEDYQLYSLDGQRLRFDFVPPEEPDGTTDRIREFFSFDNSRFLALGGGVAGAAILEHPGGMLFAGAVPGREEELEQGEIVEMEITRRAEVYGVPLDEEE